MKQQGCGIEINPAIWPRARGNIILCLLLFVLGLLVYANSFPGNFYIDDVHIVAENPLVESIDLRAIFSTDYWGPAVNRSGVFRPLTILSFALNRKVLGHETWSYHVVNVILHAMVGSTLFMLLIVWGVNAARAFFAAALFALHPIHTEVLNMMVGRSELLTGFFLLLALILAAGTAPWRLWAAGLCFLLGLLSKEHAITFLASLLLSDLFFRRNIRQRLPFYTALLALTGCWLLYRQFGLEYNPLDPFKNSAQINAIYQPLELLTTPVRVLTALKIQILFLARQLLPLNLQAVYSGQVIAAPVISLFSGWGIIILAITAALTVLGYYGWRRHHCFSLAIFLYAVSFSVTANIFFVSGVLMAERSAYLPSAWFCTALVTLLPEPSRLMRPGRNFLLALLVLLAAGFSVATLVRNIDFRDPIRLWSKDFERDQGNIIAGTYLIDALIQKDMFGEAIRIGNRLLDQHPNLPESLEMQAWLLVRDGRPEEALTYAEKALHQMPDTASEGLITTLVEINFLLNRPREVLKWLDRQNQSARFGYYWELKGNAHAALGEYREAIESYRRIGEPPPGSEVPYRMERLLRELGDFEEAEKIRRWIESSERQFGDEKQLPQHERKK